MNKHDVNIKVPSSDKQSSVIVVTGPKAYVESAKQGLYIGHVVSLCLFIALRWESTKGGFKHLKV